MKEVNIGTNVQAKFRVARLDESAQYSQYADILNAVFNKDDEISFDEADQAIEEYLGRRV